MLILICRHCRHADDKDVISLRFRCHTYAFHAYGYAAAADAMMLTFADSDGIMPPPACYADTLLLPPPLPPLRHYAQTLYTHLLCCHIFSPLFMPIRLYAPLAAVFFFFFFHAVYATAPAVFFVTRLSAPMRCRLATGPHHAPPPPSF